MLQKPIESELSTRLSTRLSTSCRLDCRLVVYCRSYGTWTGRRRGVHGTWAARGRDADGTWTGSARDMDGVWAGNGRDVDRTTGELCSFEPATGSFKDAHGHCAVFLFRRIWLRQCNPRRQRAKATPCHAHRNKNHVCAMSLVRGLRCSSNRLQPTIAPRHAHRNMKPGVRRDTGTRAAQKLTHKLPELNLEGYGRHCGRRCSAPLLSSRPTSSGRPALGSTGQCGANGRCTAWPSRS
jgi:hypothetical protein